MLYPVSVPDLCECCFVVIQSYLLHNICAIGFEQFRNSVGAGRVVLGWVLLLISDRSIFS